MSRAVLAVAIPRKSVTELCGIEIRPVATGEVQLETGKLPQQRVTDALLVTDADEQVRLRYIGQRHVRRQHLLYDDVGCDAGLRY